MNSPAPSLPPLLTINNSIAHILLRRPAQANRIETGDLAVLMDHVNELSNSPTVRAVVIEAEGRYFSSGYDLGQVLEIAKNNPEGIIENPFEPVIEAVERLPQVTIARLHGGVYGGSTDLALACDFRVGSSNTEMFMPAAALGLLYYPSGIKRFVSRLDANHAKRLFLLGEKIDANEMQRIGFLTDLVAPDELDARIGKMTERLAALAPRALEETKRAINAISRGDFDLNDFKLREANLLRSSDLREGLAATREKRVPNFTGK
jgi:enoyl-CoA hydratase/carnithine racemase